MSNQFRIYALDNLTPEVRAVTFAKCSRSPESFDEIAKELTEEKSARFHEKWVVGYGHSSVAEHAVLSIAIENVSILAAKVIEDNRLASYTEKSTRYQVFDRDRYYKPKNIMESAWARIYEEAGNFLFDTYQLLWPKLLEHVKKQYPQEPRQSDKLYAMVNRARTCDIIRYLLPTATLTNLGLTANARSLEYAIVKLLSHPLPEMNDIGQEMKTVSLRSCPTLVKFAFKNNYLIETREALEKEALEVLSQEAANSLDSVKLVSYDKDAENKIAASLLYRFSNKSYDKIYSQVQLMSQSAKEGIIDQALKRAGEHDKPLRELEHVYYTFDILVDYGAFRDIQRHRMCTQTNQDLGLEYGYARPQSIEAAGIKSQYDECMNRAGEVYQKIFKDFPKEAQYILPLAYKKRVLITCNLRELGHFISLRSGPKGHPAYRIIAQECWKKLAEVQPFLARYIRVNMEKNGVSWAASMENKDFVYNVYAARGLASDFDNK